VRLVIPKSVVASGLLALLALATVSLKGQTGAVQPGFDAAELEVLRSKYLNLPPAFQQRIADRAAIDTHQIKRYAVEATGSPTPDSAPMVRRPYDLGIRLVEPVFSETAAGYRENFQQVILPPRGFKAPILQEATNGLGIAVLPTLTNSLELAVAEMIQQRLAHDGLLSTLARALHQLGAKEFITNGRPGLRRLRALGFPDDLLACFANGRHDDPNQGSLEVIQYVAGRLVEGAGITALEAELATRSFRLPAVWSRFQILSESGEHPLEMLRMQVGGGYADGIVPGDNIDVIHQLVSGFPQASFTLSVPAEMAEAFHGWARQALPLRKRQQLTLIVEPHRLESWAQDNGKAGFIKDAATGRDHTATITPRYASRHEGASAFLPSESFLMDGLRASGHRVVHFPLLFQGGNLLAVTDPVTDKRLLIVGEGEIHRNVALGLTRTQVTEAFRRGFGVDECVVLPGASYHLDFDLNLRAVKGELVAFVNDPLAAARAVLELAIDSFERHGVIDRSTAIALRYDLNGREKGLAHQRLSELAFAGQGSEGTFGAETALLFKASGVDSATGNLQVFLQALDLLEGSAAETAGPPATGERADYLAALRRMLAAHRTQLAALQSLGWKIVPVPSMPNLYRGINYLNGIHHQDGYVMPVFGGFYAPLDQAAKAVFRETLGEHATILPIQCAELQRKHGAVHCVAVAYPAAP
jgi:hypothetical protein